MSSNSRSTARNKVNNDPVDELKRRSRRRLVGSIALFLAAIIIVPALVENEPARTSSEIELVVPERPSTETPAEIARAPVVPPASVEKAAPAPAPAPVAQATPVAPPPVPVPKVEPKPQVKPDPIQAEPKPEVKPEVKPEPKPVVKPEPKSEAKVEPKPEVKPEPKPAAKAEPQATEDPIAVFGRTETFWVQVAAVADKARAEALSKELSGKGFPARVEAASGSNGPVYRVRVGPLSGQSQADETKARLSSSGYSSGRVVQ